MQHLAQPCRITLDPRRQAGIEPDAERDALLCGLGRELLLGRAHGRLQVEGNLLEHQLAGLEPRDIEHVVDHRQERLG